MIRIFLDRNFNFQKAIFAVNLDNTKKSAEEKGFCCFGILVGQEYQLIKNLYGGFFFGENKTFSFFFFNQV